jgi:hypothetical protein
VNDDRLSRHRARQRTRAAGGNPLAVFVDGAYIEAANVYTEARDGARTTVVSGRSAELESLERYAESGERPYVQLVDPSTGTQCCSWPVVSIARSHGSFRAELRGPPVAFE